MPEPDDPRPDADLLDAVRRGEADAMDALIRRYQPRVFRFGLRMCGDRDDAGDIVQETLLALARKIGDFRGESSISTWLYAVARNACLRKRRRSKFAPAREQSLESLDAGQRDAIADPGTGPEQAAFGHEIERALAAAIGALDAGQRDVLVLRDVEGLSAGEVATVLGLNVAAVKSRLHRARLAVRTRVAPALGIPAPGPVESTCPDVVTLLSRHLEGEIGQDVCAQMEAHLVGCTSCSAACQSLRRTIALCRTTPGGEVPPEVAAAVREAFRVFAARPGA